MKKVELNELRKVEGGKFFWGKTIIGERTGVNFHAFGIFDESGGKTGERCLGLLVNLQKRCFYLVFEMSGFEFFQLDNNDGNLHLTILNKDIF